jgi:hypothetical protein
MGPVAAGDTRGQGQGGGGVATPQGRAGAASPWTGERPRRAAISGAFRRFISVPPEVAEPIGRELRIPDGVDDVLVAQVALDGPRVVPVVGELVSAGVPEHVRMDGKAQLRLLAGHWVGRSWGLARWSAVALS